MAQMNIQVRQAGCLEKKDSLTFWSGDKAGAVVEFAFVFPLFIAILAGILEFGFIIWEKHVLTAATREGAIVAATNSSVSSEAIKNLVKTRIKEWGVDNTNVTVLNPKEESIEGDSSRKLKVITASKPYAFKLTPNFFKAFSYLLGGDPTSSLIITGKSQAVKEF